MESSQAGFDEYQKFVWRMNPPRIVVDNESSETATLFKVDSSNRHGILLEVVQILTDLDLRIQKAFISSDGGWFMDVFHVSDASGKKVTDEETIGLIEKCISTSHENHRRRVGIHQKQLLEEVEEEAGNKGGDKASHTTIELTGTDRPGLMSEISALLAQMRCNIVAAELWTHNMRVACLIHVTDEATGGGIEDKFKLYRIKESLCKVLKGDNNGSKGAKTDFIPNGAITHMERRLHQMMFADRDYERGNSLNDENDDDNDKDEQCNDWGLRPNGKVSVRDCDERGYSVVHIECRNRPKLVFDTICTLTDMQYVVFHATIDTHDGKSAYQEYYIRHIDGCTLNSQAERRRVIQCLRAAIERRVSEGLRLELCTTDRVGLLSDVTRIFREHGLSVMRAGVSTRNNKACNVFYVKDASGRPVDAKVLESVRREIGQTILKVSEVPIVLETQETRPKFSLGNLFGMPSQVLHSLGLIKSYS